MKNNFMEEKLLWPFDIETWVQEKLEKENSKIDIKENHTHIIISTQYKSLL